jgi:putative transposase
MPRARRPYPSDLTDQEWKLLQPLLASPKRRGRPPKWPPRRVLADAVFYLLRSGCAWRMLPREHPPWQGRLLPLSQMAPRRTVAPRSPRAAASSGARVGRARPRSPSGAVIDSQALKGRGVGGPERGYDGAKRLSGRKHQLLVDTGGLVLGARVHAASVHDREDGGRRLLEEALAQKLPRLALVWADAAYTGRFRGWAHDERGWRVEEVPSHPDRQLWRYGLEEKPSGFQVLPSRRRWVVERTFAWLGQARRLAKYYERLPETAVAMI